MSSRILPLAAACTAAALFSCASPSSKSLPGWVILEGTLANDPVVRDATAGAHAKLAAKGVPIKAGGPAKIWVVSPLTGRIGLRRWTEEWIFSSSQGDAAVIIDFREMGNKAVGWRIRD